MPSAAPTPRRSPCQWCGRCYRHSAPSPAWRPVPPRRARSPPRAARARDTPDVGDSRPRTSTRTEHVLGILRMLETVVLEDLPRGHADHAGLDTLGLELFIRLDAQRDLAAGRQQQNLGCAVLSLGQ